MPENTDPFTSPLSSPERTAIDIMRELLRLDTLRSNARLSPAQKRGYDTAFEKCASVLLQRSRPLNIDPAYLAMAPVERQFESILAHEFITHFPAAALKVVHSLAQGLATRIRNLPAQARLAAYYPLRGMMLPDGPEFWRKAEPFLDELKNSTSAKDADARVLAFLDREPANGIQAMALLFLVRDMLRALFYKHLDPAIAQSMEAAQDFYLKKIFHTKMPIIGEVNSARVAAEGMGEPAAGITTPSVPSAIPNAWMLPSQRPLQRCLIDTTNPHAADSLRKGNVVVTGLSGTTSLLLFNAKLLYPAVTQKERQHLVAALACVLIYAGGHSANEVMEVVAMLHELEDSTARTGASSKKAPSPRSLRSSKTESTSTAGAFTEPAGYSRGAARLYLHEVFESIGLGNLKARAIRRLVDYFKAHPGLLQSDDSNSTTSGESESDSEGEELRIGRNRRAA
jgi:hypothetical protein